MSISTKECRGYNQKHQFSWYLFLNCNGMLMWNIKHIAFTKKTYAYLLISIKQNRIGLYRISVMTFGFLAFKLWAQTMIAVGWLALNSTTFYTVLHSTTDHFKWNTIMLQHVLHFCLNMFLVHIFKKSVIACHTSKNDI